MFKKIASLVLAVCIVTYPASSYADLPAPPEPQPGESPVGEVVSPMKQGQKAPFTGLLLSPAAVAKLIVELQHEQEARDIESKKARDTQKALDQLTIDDLNSKVKYVETTRDAAIKSRDEQIKIISKKLEEAEKNRTNPTLWVGLGAAGGVLLSVVTVFAVSRAAQ